MVHIDEGFDFLGFHIRRQRKRGTQKHYVYTKPSRKAIQAIKDKVKAKTYRSTRHMAPDELITSLNRLLAGWANYFRYGVSKAVFGAIDSLAWGRIMRWLRAKYKCGRIPAGAVPRPRPAADHRRPVRGRADHPSVFTDLDGAAYLYWGNGVAHGVRLDPDMISFDSSKVVSWTPAGFREAAHVHARAGVYYLSWSVDDARDENYHVRYATGHSPLGPWTDRGVLLARRPTGASSPPATTACCAFPGPTSGSSPITASPSPAVTASTARSPSIISGTAGTAPSTR